MRIELDATRVVGKDNDKLIVVICEVISIAQSTAIEWLDEFVGNKLALVGRLLADLEHTDEIKAVWLAIESTVETQSFYRSR